MEGTIVHNLLRATRNQPEKLAIHHNNKFVSYQELWILICQCSDFLVKNGLKKSERVAIQYENSVEYIVVYYATLKAGGVIVALNTDSKLQDLNNILSHCDARFLFASQKKVGINDLEITQDIKLIILDSNKKHEDGSLIWEDVIKKGSVDNDEEIYTNQTSMAAIIYTSGTTGNPKGVVLSHINLLTNINSIINYLKLDEKDSILNVLPFFYSYGNSVLHTHLSVGASIYLENSMMYPAKVVENIAQYQVTGFSGVPSTFALLLSRTKLENYDLSSVRYVTQAGGAMPPANIKSFISRLPSADFVVMYGQTEATARISYLPPDRLIEKMGSVGVPIPGVQIEIRNDEGCKIEKCKSGEVYVSGQNIMKGYWKNPQATSEVIVDGWLKTGDLGYMDDEGYIYLSGRKLDMIKVGGHRISPLEIEEIISQVTNVEEAAVTGIDDEVLGQVVKAVVVLKERHDTAIREIKAYCAKQLPIYKMPKEIEIVESLPKTSSGKVKRFLL